MVDWKTWEVESLGFIWGPAEEGWRVWVLLGLLYPVRYNGVTTADTSPQGNQISGGEMVGNYRSVVTPIDCPSQKCQAKGKFRHHINNLG